MLLDLLTAAEEKIDAQTSHLRFDIDLLTTRLMQATEWAAEDHALSGLKASYFGASTGAAAALMAAAQHPFKRAQGAANALRARPERIEAVVSRGGRPDLAGAALGRVKAPTLLIVGGDDLPVIGLNEKALGQIGRAHV